MFAAILCAPNGFSVSWSEVMTHIPVIDRYPFRIWTAGRTDTPSVFRAGLSFEKDSNICLTEKRRAGTFLPFYMTWLIRRASHGEDTEKTQKDTEKTRRRTAEIAK